MIPLKLPSYNIKLSGTKEHPLILDSLRKKYVSLTPEEWVRQHFVHFLIEEKGFPAPLLANEVGLSCGNKQLRADSILYNKSLKPQVNIEYKAPSVTITQKVFDQISAYNMLLHVDYLIVSNGLQHFCCKMDYENHSYHFLKDIPSYSEIIESAP